MRKSGILMHISSLPGACGIGSMGKEAFAFVDFLKAANQLSWQMLPLTPTGYGDSPYQSCSTFAGNPNLIDLEQLVKDGLLLQEELDDLCWCDSEVKVDFGRQYHNRRDVLRKAFARFTPGDDFRAFREANGHWLADFALFMALKDEQGGAWNTWEDGLKFRYEDALNAAWERLENDIDYYCFVQYVFYRQWDALRAYAKEAGIELIGDVPIYVPYDSVEVWKDPQLFQLDEDLTPTAVAGCPPDAFSDDGQLWGNPLYRWELHEEQDFSWWLNRLGAAGKLFDVIRLDHFRGFEAYWSVPYGDKTAKNGHWVPGPAEKFVNAVKNGLPELNFIAEDLGYLTEGVLKLRDDSGYPGMKVLGFAFDSREPADYLPYTYIPNTVCYTGTHDNMTTKQWFDTASEDAAAYAREFMVISEKEGDVWGTIRTAMSSVSARCIVPMQDYLELGAEGRMNFPGTMGTNWTWRAEKGYNSEKLAKRIAAMVKLYGRSRPAVKAEEIPAEEEEEKTAQ